jgi:phosphomannomutase/phosphoglucomutase
MSNLFGTNGVRGIINKGFTVELVLDLARAVGTVLGPGSVALSRDSRIGGEMFSSAAKAGLLSTGCSVIDIGPAPTPALQFSTPRLGCVAGVMITASHNPAEFNGIKVMGSNGIEVSRAVEKEIEASYFSKSFKSAPWDEVGSVTAYTSVIREYIDAIKSHVDLGRTTSRCLTVVVDGANSTGSLVTPFLLREMGCKVISLNSQLDGHFPGRPPEPIPENIAGLSKVVVAVGADLGIAHDGDADRATFVDETGKVLWGDQSFAIIAKHVLSQRPGSLLVTPVSSGRLIEDIATAEGAKIEWTEVGSVVVSHRILELGADLGGEENGGVFYPSHQAVRDGAMTAAQMVDILAVRGLSLSQLVAELPKYFSSKRKIPVPPEKKDSILGQLLQITEEMSRITLDGVKIMYEDGWVLLRPSGTEPLWRCFSEARSQSRADALAEQGAMMIGDAISRL